jgi:hypothetical protein
MGVCGGGMNKTPNEISNDGNKAIVKAGKNMKNSIPDEYEYREPVMSKWLRALSQANSRDDCCDEDGNITARFWTNGVDIWPTPEYVEERTARQIKYKYFPEEGYLPLDL